MYKDFIKKVRYVFLLFLFVSVFYTIFCTLLCRYFVFEKKLITIDDEALFSVSILLCWLVVFIWLKPRFQLLNIKDNTALGWQFILIIFLIIINSILYNISKNNYDKLALVNDISQLGEIKNNANCYEVKDYIIANDIYKTYYSIDQLDDRFSIKLYCVIPMFSSFEYEERKIEHFREQDTLANGVDSIRNLPFSSIRYWYAFSFYDSFKDDNDYKNEKKIDISA